MYNNFHAFYSTVRILPDAVTIKENSLFQARLLLCDAVAHVLRHGLTVLGIHAPDRMEQNTDVTLDVPTTDR